VSVAAADITSYQVFPRFQNYTASKCASVISGLLNFRIADKPPAEQPEAPSSVALGFIVMTGRSAWSPPGSLSLCIVHTKSHSSDQYEPSAGPDAIAMYQELVGRRLQNGATLQITVLPASMQQEIEPEVHRLNCSWVLQLWYRRNADVQSIEQFCLVRETSPRTNGQYGSRPSDGESSASMSD
jgi:hypothetical protein